MTRHETVLQYIKVILLGIIALSLAWMQIRH